MIDGFMAGNEDGCFRAIMIGDSENAIKAIEGQKFNNKVHGNCFKG